MSHGLSESPETPNTPRQNDDGRKAWFAMGLHALWLLSIAGGLMLISRYFPISDYLANAQRKIAEGEMHGALWHPFLFALCNVLLLPGGILAIGAGLFFGLWNAWILNLIGSVLGAAAAFFIARKLGRTSFISRLITAQRWQRLESGVQREGWKFVFFSQLHPLFPTSLLNYLYGLTPIRPASCLLWIGLGQAPGLFLYAYIGTMAKRGLDVWKGDLFLSKADWLIWIVGFLIAGWILIILGRISLRILKDASARD